MLHALQPELDADTSQDMEVVVVSRELADAKLAVQEVAHDERVDSDELAA